MISPISVIHRVMEGQAPPNWLVLRPAGLPGPIMCTVLTSIGTIFIMFYGTFLTLLVMGITPSFLLHQSSAGPFGQPMTGITMALLSLTIIIVKEISRPLTKYCKRKSDSVLILLPEGVVSCENFSDDVKRSWNVIEYVDITRITMYMSTQYRILLTLQYRDGRWENWHIDGNYRSPERIAQRVIRAHTIFTASHPA